MIAHGPLFPRHENLLSGYDRDNPKSWKGAATTNLLLGSDFTNTAQWIAYGTPGSTNSFWNYGIRKTPFYKMTDASAAYLGVRHNGYVTVSSSTDYTLSIWFLVNPSEEGRSHYRVASDGESGLYSLRLFHATGAMGIARNDIGFTSVDNGYTLYEWNGMTFSHAWATFTTGAATTGIRPEILVGHDPDGGATICTGYFGGPQLELGGPSRWVDGSRSSAESMIDLAGNTSLTVSSLTPIGIDDFEWDGVDDQIYTGLVPATYSSFSIGFWIYPYILSEIPEVNDYRIYISSSVQSNFILCETSGKLTFRIPGIDNNAQGPNSAVSVNTWQHFMCVYDDVGQKYVYKNGELIYNQPAATSGAASLGFLYYGRQSTNHEMKGKMPHVAVWDLALNAEEVFRHFALKRKVFGI